MSAIENLLSRLESVRQKQAGGWMAKCPSHDDRTPSLSIDEAADGTALVYCFASCSSADVMAAVGLSLADLFEKRLDDSPGRPRRRRPSMTARDAIEILDHERLVILEIIADAVKRGVSPDTDLDRLILAGQRLQNILEIIR